MLFAAGLAGLLLTSRRVNLLLNLLKLRAMGGTPMPLLANLLTLRAMGGTPMPLLLNLLTPWAVGGTPMPLLLAPARAHLLLRPGGLLLR